MKKRLLIYISVIIGCLFIGLTTFYLVKNHEFISVTASNGNEVYLNLKETENLSIVHDKKAKGTNLSASISDDTIISFDLESGTITALKGGKATLTVNSSNENFGPFTFEVNVGDGKSLDTPFYIKAAEDLRAVGNTRTYDDENSQSWSMDSFYQMINSVNLGEKEWTPIGSYSDDKPFTGSFSGEGNTIFNMSITEDAESAGLFAYLSQFASVDSVRFENANINGAFDYVGVVAGVSEGAKIERVEVVKTNILVAPGIFSDLMVGGIVGASTVDYEKEMGAHDGYLYTRTTITMSSFEGVIELKDEIANEMAEDGGYVALGGIVGFNLGATILNNKSEVSFNISEDLVSLTETSNKVKIQVGGIVGIVYYEEIEENKEVVKTIYPLIKNNLAIMTCDNLTRDTSGVIGKLPYTVQESGQQWVFGNYFFTDNSSLTFGGSVWNNSTIKIMTLSDLKKSETYVTETFIDGTAAEKWSIGESISVWIIDEGVSSPEINFLVGIGQEATYPSESYTIYDIDGFKYYYEKLTLPVSKQHEILSRKFWLSQNYILDTDINLFEAGFTNFTPIGYDHTFKGTFDGNGHKIYFNSEESSEIPFVNNLEGGGQRYNYAGIFAIVNTGAEVRNLTVEGLSVDFAQFTGGIAGINLGTISNCYIKDMQIGSAYRAGFIAGVNKGTIQNTVESVIVEGEEEEEVIDYSVIVTSFQDHISIKDQVSATYVGGAVGYNTGTILNIKIQGVFFIVGQTTGQTTGADSIRVVGGFVGYNKGTISNCSAEQAYLSDHSKIRVYMGGFCGINDGVIESSYTGIEEGTMATTVKTDLGIGNQIAGGFVARLGYYGSLEKCFAIIDIQGYYAAGLAADLLGSASECYVKGSVSGVFIGGFACNMAFKSEPAKGGILTNSYNTVRLTGAKKESLSAGLALFIRKPGKIENCFASNIFAGEGAKYYESFTDTRLRFVNYTTSKIAPVEGFGLVNNVVINTEAEGAVNEEVKDSGRFFADKSQKVYYLTNADCLSGKDAFVAADFSVGETAYWTIEEGFYPTLTNLTLDNISQLPSPDEEVEEEVEEGSEDDEISDEEGLSELP